MKKKALIIYTDQLSKRSMETSQIIKELRLKFDVEFLDEDHLNKRNFLIKKISRFFNRILQFRFSEIYQIKKHLLKKKYQSKFKTNTFDDTNIWLGFPFSKNKTVFQFLFKLYSKLPCFLEFPKVDLILITGAQEEYAQCVFKFYHKTKTPIIVIINNWDHLTSHGPVLNAPGIKKYLVWGEMQQKELIAYHNVNKNKIAITGCLQFDQLNQMKSKQTNLNSLFKGLEELILFLPASEEKHGYCEPDIILATIEMLNAKNQKFSIIIRPNKADKSFNDRFEKVIKLKNIFVIKATNDMKKDRTNYALILKHCSLVLCGPGMVAVEAMFFRKPVVFLAIENRFGYENIDISKERFFTDHYEKIMNHNPGYLVTSFVELKKSIDEILIGDELKLKGQQKVLDEQITYSDGLTWNRVMNEIIQL